MPERDPPVLVYAAVTPNHRVSNPLPEGWSWSPVAGTHGRYWYVRRIGDVPACGHHGGEAVHQGDRTRVVRVQTMNADPFVAALRAAGVHVDAPARGTAAEEGF